MARDAIERCLGTAGLMKEVDHRTTNKWPYLGVSMLAMTGLDPLSSQSLSLG